MADVEVGRNRATPIRNTVPELLKSLDHWRQRFWDGKARKTAASLVLQDPTQHVKLYIIVRRSATCSQSAVR